MGAQPSCSLMPNCGACSAVAGPPMHDSCLLLLCACHSAQHKQCPVRTLRIMPGGQACMCAGLVVTAARTLPDGMVAPKATSSHKERRTACHPQTHIGFTSRQFEAKSNAFAPARAHAAAGCGVVLVQSLPPSWARDIHACASQQPRSCKNGRQSCWVGAQCSMLPCCNIARCCDKGCCCRRCLGCAWRARGRSR